MWPFNNSEDPRKKKKADAPRVRSSHVRQTSRTRADATIRANEAIYAAVSRISNTVASIPVHLYKGWEIQTDHPLERLISLRPNDAFSSFGFLQTMEVCRNTEGNAYALIRRDGLGAVKALDILDPTKVTPGRDADTKELLYGVQIDGATYPLPGCELLALRHMSGSGEQGIRPIDVLSDSLAYDRKTKEFSIRQMSGVNQGVMLEVPSTGMNTEAKHRIVEDFLDAYEHSGERVLILEGGLKATPFSQNPVNAQVLDVERITRNRVATVYNIPPHLLGDYTDTSFSTAEQQMQEFLNLTILPIVTQWEQELNRKLLTDADYDAGYRFRFDLAALGRADTATMANKYQQAVRGGWMTPNEVREREGMPAEKDGGQLMSSRDLIPLSIAVNTPEWLLGYRPASDGGKEE